MNADTDLERTLTELGTLVEWPAFDDMTARVADRIAHAPQPHRRWIWASRPRLALAIAAVLLLAIAGALASKPARDTVADRLGLPGINITSRDRLPPAGGALQLGERLPTSDALERAGFDAAPPPESLGKPDTYLLVSPWGSQISYAYRASASLPEVENTGVGLLISQLQGSTNDSFIAKLLDPGSTLEMIDIDGVSGFWIAGRAHGFIYAAPDGSFHEEQIRLAGNVLIWTRDGTTYRIESALPLDRVLEIARELRPPG